MFTCYRLSYWFVLSKVRRLVSDNREMNSYTRSLVGTLKSWMSLFGSLRLPPRSLR